MFHHKKHNPLQRLVMFLRDVKAMATTSINCPGCGSGNVSGSGDGPFSCGNCGSMWQ